MQQDNIPVEETEATQDMPQENVEELRGLLAKEQEKAQSYLTNWQIAAADFINYKRRSEHERAEVRSVANAMLISKMLPVFDDLERVLTSDKNGKTEINTLLEGVKNILRKFSSIIESEGITVIKTDGQDFDPSIHEAILEGAGEPGKVVAEVRKGYKYNDRVIRPAQVIVGIDKSGKEK